MRVWRREDVLVMGRDAYMSYGMTGIVMRGAGEL